MHSARTALLDKLSRRMNDDFDVEEDVKDGKLAISPDYLPHVSANRVCGKLLIVNFYSITYVNDLLFVTVVDLLATSILLQKTGATTVPSLADQTLVDSIVKARMLLISKTPVNPHTDLTMANVFTEEGNKKAQFLFGKKDNVIFAFSEVVRFLQTDEEGLHLTYPIAGLHLPSG